jgi:hypothetical protein
MTRFAAGRGQLKARLFTDMPLIYHRQNAAF